jgi:hypothetical protein
MAATEPAAACQAAPVKPAAPLLGLTIVCTENLNPSVVVMKSAQDGA